MIWQRWTKDFLAQNQTRNKCSKSEKQTLSLSDLVWTIDDDTKRSDYQMVRVVQLHPEKDDIVRSVTVKTSKNTYKQP